MDLDLLLLLGLYLFSTFVAIAFFLQRYRWHRRRRFRRSNWGFYPTAGSLGNALHHLQAIAQPPMQYVLEEKLDEKQDEDDEAAPKDPTVYLLRQAEKIRSGEGSIELTAICDPRLISRSGSDASSDMMSKTPIQ